jgi:hypothetical protein
MSIVIKKEDDGLLATGVLENCCFCGLPTRYWAETNDVPVCRSCAPRHDIGDVPSKHDLYADGYETPETAAGILRERAAIHPEISEMLAALFEQISSQGLTGVDFVHYAGRKLRLHGRSIRPIVDVDTTVALPSTKAVRNASAA